MATARKTLFDKFAAAQTEEEQLAVCTEHVLLNLEEYDRTDDIDGFKYRMNTLKQVVCEDAKKPEIYERFQAKALERLSPEWRKRLKELAKNMK